MRDHYLTWFKLREKEILQVEIEQKSIASPCIAKGASMFDSILAAIKLSRAYLFPDIAPKTCYLVMHVI